MYAIGEMERSSPRPRWGWLYGIVAVVGGLLTVVEVAIPDGLARRVLECIATLAIFGTIAIWVRVNRVGLALDEGSPTRPRPRAASPIRSTSKRWR